MIAIAAAICAVGCSDREASQKGVGTVVLQEPEVYRAQLEDLLGAGQPAEGANAWDEIFAALDGIKAVREWSVEVWDPTTPLREDPMTSADEMRFDPLVLAERKPGIEFLRRVEHAGVWAALDRAREAPRRVPPFLWEADQGAGNLSSEQIKFNRLLPIINTLVSAMRAAHATGDEDGVVDGVRRLATIAAVVGECPDSVMWTKGAVACTLMCREVCQQIMERAWTEKTLARVDAELRGIDVSPRVWVEAAPVVERFAASADPEGYAPRIGEPSVVIAIVDAVIVHTVEQLEKPVSQRERPGAGYSERLTETMWTTRDMGDDFDARMAVIPVADRIVGSVDLVISQGVWAQVMVSGTRAVIAVERYRAEKGALPESLEALSPEYIERVPTDPMTGGPIGYRRVEGDAHGREYVVYSTGIDGVDDGGRAMESDTYLNPSELGAGFDFIVNVPRRGSEW